MKRSEIKGTRIERTEQKKRVTEYHQAGTGMYVFRNRSSVASLELPKPSADGKKWVAPGQTWRGDSYFLKMVPREATLVEAIQEQIKEEKMAEKLILDQPDQITSSGKVEHSVVGDEMQINEVGSEDTKVKSKEKLITEDPLAGVTIIRD
jgi:hypothetical protein